MRYGIDLKENNKQLPQFADVKREDNTLNFTGNLSDGPNLDAIKFLLEKILPMLWERKLEVKIYFLGVGAPDFLKNHPDERIIVTGFVDSLIPYMKKTSLFVSPLFFGAGTKTKVLEVMGHGKVVVGTKESFTEIECQDERDCIVIDPPRDTEQWVNKIISLLVDKDRIRQVEVEAKKTVESHHDWEVNKLAYVKELTAIKGS